MVVIKAGATPEASRAAQRDERKRVNGIIARDQADAAREQMRKQAEREMKGGNFEHIADTVVEPTPEWLEQGEVAPFTPRQHDGTTRIFRTVRRVQTPVIVRLHRAGKISDEQYTACAWYALTYEQAGMEGRYSSSQYSATGSVQRSVKVGGFGGHMAMHATEAEAREAFRQAREAISAGALKFFESVVLHGVPIHRAKTHIRSSTRGLLGRFQLAVNQLVVHCRDEKIEVVPHELQSGD